MKRYQSVEEARDEYFVKVEIGDTIELCMEDRDDIELSEWLDENDTPLVVSGVEYETGMVWLEDCPYGIDMAFITEVFKQVQ